MKFWLSLRHLQFKASTFKARERGISKLIGFVYFKRSNKYMVSSNGACVEHLLFLFYSIHVESRSWFKQSTENGFLQLNFSESKVPLLHIFSCKYIQTFQILPQNLATKVHSDRTLQLPTQPWVLVLSKKL